MNRSRGAAPAAGAALLSLALLLSPALCSAATSGQIGSASLDGFWTELRPPNLERTAAVYDPVRQSMLVFGGWSINSESFSNDTWELSLSGPLVWTLLETTGGKPAPRAGHALLFDSRRERLLVYGGADSVTKNDFWTLDLTTSPPTWEQALPTGPLPPRAAYCQAVYDSLYDRVVIFGGADSLKQGDEPLSFVADLWALPVDVPTQWTELTPVGTPPSARAGAAVVYDEPRQRMVLFGGLNGLPLDDSFTLSLDVDPAWAPLGATGGPPPARAVPTLVHDAPQQRLVLFGGLALQKLADVWELDLAANAWTELFPSGVTPSARQQASGIYDAPRDRMVMFGGSSDTTGDVPDPLWALSLGSAPAWTDLGRHHPKSRVDAASAVDPVRRVMWVHGGVGNETPNGQHVRSDLWAFQLGNADGWSEPATLGEPLGRRSAHVAIYDAPRDRLIFFGGEDLALFRNDVWALTLSGTPTWSEQFVGGSPPSPRVFPSAVYDPVNQRMVIFGGRSNNIAKNDVWALSLTGTPIWTELHPTGDPPPPLVGQSGALDPVSNRLILYGGYNGVTGLLSDSVYCLTLTGSPAWGRILPTGNPPPRRLFASMVSTGSQMLITGGNGSSASFIPRDDTWLLSLYPPSWRELDVGPEIPPRRVAHVTGYDSTSTSLTLFGGLGAANTKSDTWQLQLYASVPALVSLVSANARAGRVELAWEVSSTLEGATVQRSTDGAVWADLGSVLQDGSGRLAYVDLDVISGTRYGYRLALPDGTKSAAAWVEVPAAASFALRGMSPNPGPASAALVSFTLPDASPARLEVMDIAGRQVFAREVGSLGPGEHFVRVSGEAPLAPGVYLVRLTRGGQSLTAKAVATR